MAMANIYIYTHQLCSSLLTFGSFLSVSCLRIPKSRSKRSVVTQPSVWTHKHGILPMFIPIVAVCLHMFAILGWYLGLGKCPENQDNPGPPSFTIFTSTGPVFEPLTLKVRLWRGEVGGESQTASDGSGRKSQNMWNRSSEKPQKLEYH